MHPTLLLFCSHLRTHNPVFSRTSVSMTHQLKNLVRTTLDAIGTTVAEPLTSDYKILSSLPSFHHFPSASDGFFPSSPIQLPVEKNDQVLLQLGLTRKAKMGPKFGPDPSLLTMKCQAQSATRLCIEIENAAHQAWKVPHSIVPRYPPSNPVKRHQELDETLDYEMIWNDPNSFSFTVLRKGTGEKLFDTSSLGVTMKDQYIELSTHLGGKGERGGQVANLYGLGENVGPLRRQPGTTTTMWARDSPCKPNTNLYGCHPFYMEVLPSGSAHGVLLLSSNGMDIVFSPEGDKLTYKVIGGAVELYIFTGPTPQQVIQQYTELIGRPCMIPYYAQGFHICRWGYDTLDKVKDVVAKFKKHSLPLEAMWVDIDYMKDYKCFTFDEERFPVKQLAEYVDQLHAQDQHMVMILDPGIKVQYQSGLYEPYDEGVAKGLFVKRRVKELEVAEDGTKYHEGDLVDFVGKVWPGKTTFPDWFNPGTQSYWTKYITEWYKKVPLDGIWIDMNEAASFHDGDCSHIESSEDRPIQPSDFALATVDPDEEADGAARIVQPQHAGANTKKKTDQTTDHHVDPKDAIAQHEREYEEQHDPHHPEREHLETSILSARNSPPLTVVDQQKTKPPIIYKHPNQPPYKINNNNEYADLEYRTISPDALHYGGITEYDAHNLYGHMEAIATYNAMRSIRPDRKPFILSRSTFPGSGQFASKWNGDNWSAEYDLKASISGLLNFQFFGISMIGADIGGFGDAASEELLIRWHQLGAFYPFMRNHNCITNPPQEPYITKLLGDITRKYLDIRYRLLPYWYTLFYRSHQDGRMVCSPLWILDPKDQNLLSNDEQFLVGESILVSPVLKLKQSSVKAYFPPGRWYDLHSGQLEVFVESSSKFLTVEAPLEKIPLHLAGGHILPRAGIVPDAFIGTTTQVRKAPIQILVALDETDCARGEYYHDDDSFKAADGTLVKFHARPGFLSMFSYNAKSFVDPAKSSQNEKPAEIDDDTTIAPHGSRNLRPTNVQSVLIWGIGLSRVEPNKVLKTGTVSSPCQIESHQIRVSIVDPVTPPSTESIQHQRELSAVPAEEILITWNASKAQLLVEFKRPGGLQILGNQALEVDWTEALVA
ncbi:alpha-glucosidase maltase [Lobosporangium transversale]|uniref:Maltase n=1 Tax=Lobosporangium transversale TaxID=64571 RepID=A0A1Y2GCI2_9FUNG|nr:glycosyl hydrolases family 31-domain-containing protein [Lobosporangium transversale]KAF9918832.1 alpha-glucosidase maltase [Lobosporangium transversale]ORZ05952.1 glycosyl hydrolases family 31-domain-containing protein [Lobosporangium transversale]|eukprot:XP_021877333.1 glycosyl hydrolases family 31-domain-containing protein [Lobosporangium transversale]